MRHYINVHYITSDNEVTDKHRKIQRQRQVEQLLLTEVDFSLANILVIAGRWVTMYSLMSCDHHPSKECSVLSRQQSSSATVLV